MKEFGFCTLKWRKVGNKLSSSLLGHRGHDKTFYLKLFKSKKV